jgi:hypothetical protein
LAVTRENLKKGGVLKNGMPTGVGILYSQTAEENYTRKHGL